MISTKQELQKSYVYIVLASAAITVPITLYYTHGNKEPGLSYDLYTNNTTNQIADGYVGASRDVTKSKFHQSVSPLDQTDEGGIYLWTNSTANISELVRSRLKGMGFEPAEDHAFKSPVIETPTVYFHNSYAAPGLRERKIISVHISPVFYRVTKSLKNIDFKRCKYPECEFDLDGDYVHKADLVIFFIEELPDNLIPRPAGQLWAVASWESPSYSSEKASELPWKGAFNLKFNYEVDADIFAPYNKFAWRHKDLLLSDAEYIEIAKKKTRPVAWFASHCDTVSKRFEYVTEMQRHIEVDVFGTCGKHTCRRSDERHCMAILNSTYHFYLSFENSFHKDYITEKFNRNFLDRTHIVPVARGGADYHKFFPRGGYIDANDFATPRDLALFLNDLKDDKPRYAQMLREKDRLVALSHTQSHDWCYVCDQLHTTRFHKTPK